MTTTDHGLNPDAAKAFALAATLDATASIEFSWYQQSDDQARTILAVFPDVDWKASNAGSTQWITGFADTIELTIFLADNGDRDHAWNLLSAVTGAAR